VCCDWSQPRRTASRALSTDEWGRLSRYEHAVYCGCKVERRKWSASVECRRLRRRVSSQDHVQQEGHGACPVRRPRTSTDRSAATATRFANTFLQSDDENVPGLFLRAITETGWILMRFGDSVCLGAGSDRFGFLGVPKLVISAYC